MDWSVSLAGFLVGSLIGMTGIGAGSLMAPLLILWFGVPPIQAVGSDLVFSAVTKLVGTVEHVRLRTVDFRAVAWMALTSIPATLLAVGALARFGTTPGVDRLILRLMGIALIVAGVGLVGRALFHRTASAAPARRRWLLGTGGAVLGGMVGLTATGSGTIGTVLLSFATRLDARRVVGTVIVHAMLLTLVGALAHFALGSVRLGLAGSLLVGSIPGVVLGSRLTVRIPDVALRAALATLLITAGLRCAFITVSHEVPVTATDGTTAELVAQTPTLTSGQP